MALVLEEVERAAVAPVADTSRRASIAGLAGWVAVVAVALAWGTVSVRTADVGLHAAPFKGHWTWHGGWMLLPAAGIGLAVAVWGPRVARSLAWRRVPIAAGAVASVWTAALAAGDGWSRLTAPLATRHEYEPFAATVGDLGRFLSTYVDRLGERPIHVQGHPPGPVVLAWALDHVGLTGAGWLALVAISSWGVAVAAALSAARRLGGEHAARRAAPALAVLPAAIWAGTSVDPVFAALTAVAIALAATRTVPEHPGDDTPAGRAVGHSPGPRIGCRTALSRSPALSAVSAGAVFGAALLFSYGAVPLGLVLAAAVVVAAPSWTSALRMLGLVAVATAAVWGLAAAAGFWWPAGLTATRAAYWDGIGSERPALYVTLVGNPSALAVALGPAAAAGLVCRLTCAIRTRRSGPADPTDSGDAAWSDRSAPVGRVHLAVPRGGADRSRLFSPAEPSSRSSHAVSPGSRAVGGGGRPPNARSWAARTGLSARLLGSALRPASATSAVRHAHAALSARALDLVVGAALVAVTLANLSQLSRGEVERIWLPFVPWLALAARGDHRGWLAAQVGLALVLQSFLASPW